MKALVLKEVLLVRGYARSLLLLIAVYFVIGAFGNNAGFFAGMSGVVCVLMVITSFSYDNYAKWDK